MNYLELRKLYLDESLTCNSELLYLLYASLIAELNINNPNLDECDQILDMVAEKLASFIANECFTRLNMTVEISSFVKLSEIMLILILKVYFATDITIKSASESSIQFKIVDTGFSDLFSLPDELKHWDFECFLGKVIKSLYAAVQFNTTLKCIENSVYELVLIEVGFA